MASFPPDVERWRSLVAKYFRPEDVDKALYVINGESSGLPDAKSPSGGYGLMQLNDGGLGEGLTPEQRLDPETNIRTSAAAVYGGSGWRPWGEGTAGQAPYDPKTGKGRFGSLGDNPYPGGGGQQMAAPGSGATGVTVPPDYYTKYARWKALDAKFGAYGDTGVPLIPDPATGKVIAQIPKGVDPTTGVKITDPQPVGTLDELNEYRQLDTWLTTAEAQYEKNGNVDDIIKAAQFRYNTDPANVDAQNSADKFARDLSVRQEAVSLANNRLTDQNTTQAQGEQSFNDKMNSSSSWGSTFRAPRTKLPSADELFQGAVDSVQKGLPDVKPRPYYTGTALPDASGRPPLRDVLDGGANALPQVPKTAPGQRPATAATKTWQGPVSPNEGILPPPGSSGLTPKDLGHGVQAWDGQQVHLGGPTGLPQSDPQSPALTFEPDPVQSSPAPFGHAIRKAAGSITGSIFRR